ncbi:MAG: type II and III secretion system protein family protein [Rhodospirillaceae bacterium]|nr:type II and III secretion system protein family protein [Rhodospirillaceae bacterium]
MDTQSVMQPAGRSPHRARLSTVLLLVALTAVAVIFAASPAAAQDAARRVLSIEVNKGRIIRLDVPVKTVFIANPEIADVQVKSPRVMYVTAKKPGETTLIAVDDNDRVLVNISLTINHNLSRLKRTLDAVMPGNRIQVRSVDGAVVLVGEASNPLEASQAVDIASRFVDKKEQIVNNIAVKGPNIVNLRVRVVEIQRAVTRQIGVNWDMAFKQGLYAFGVATGAAPALSAASALGLIGQQAGQTYNVRRQLNNSTVNNVYGRYSTNNLDLTAMVDLLEQNGMVKTLAQPNLSAMSGKSASFLAGGEFPIPVPQSDGVVTIDYKKFGVSLAFTPVILAGNRISMRVAPEVSQLSNNGAITIGNFQIPALTTRRAETMLEVASGQSFVIGGLLQNNIVRDVNKVPWLSDVPVLGKLFTSESFQRNETELVIIVTPYIVGAIREPGSAANLAEPPAPPSALPARRRGRAHRRSPTTKAAAPPLVARADPPGRPRWLPARLTARNASAGDEEHGSHRQCSAPFGAGPAGAGPTGSRARRPGIRHRLPEHGEGRRLDGKEDGRAEQHGVGRRNGDHGAPQHGQRDGWLRAALGRAGRRRARPAGALRCAQRRRFRRPGADRAGADRWPCPGRTAGRRDRARAASQRPARHPLFRRRRSRRGGGFDQSHGGHRTELPAVAGIRCQGAG